MLKKPVRFTVAIVLFALGNACSQGDPTAAPYAGMQDAGDKPLPSADPCQTPNTGCACDTPGEAVDCGQVERVSGDYVSCTMGQRACGPDGTWGSCVGDRIATTSVRPGK